MSITKNKVVSIHYTVKSEDETMIDSSEGKPPLVYLQGAKNIIKGMEEALEGKTIGDKLDVIVSPEDGYGLYDNQLKQRIPKTLFEDTTQLTIGNQFHAQTNEGMKIAKVVDIHDKEVTLDFNHELAGKVLYFHVEVLDIRDATQEEIAQQHPQNS